MTQVLAEFTAPLWAAAAPAALGMMALYFLLPRPRGIPAVVGMSIAAVALAVTAGVLLPPDGAPWIEQGLFYAFSLLALVAGGTLVVQANPARAALAFAVVVLATCGLFLLHAAPFLMAGTIIIYAGAVIVTFLFVIMLSQQEGPSNADNRSREPFLSCVAGAALLTAMIFVQRQAFAGGAFAAPAAGLPADNVAALGRAIYGPHLLGVELGGTLLLVATIGAIAITQRGHAASRPTGGDA